VSNSTWPRTRWIVFSSSRWFRTSAIQRAICRISGSFIPRVVTAGVPTRMPLATAGGLASKGMAFLLTKGKGAGTFFRASAVPHGVFQPEFPHGF